MKANRISRLALKSRIASVEPLEARIAPAAVFWDGGGDGINWTSANNWSNNAIPTSADTVTINPAGTVTITLSSGVQAVASLSMPGDDALAITGGSLALAGASTLHNLALGGSGSLFANEAVSLTGTGSLSGTATLGGTAVVTNSGTLGITSGEPNLATELLNLGTIQHGNAYLDLDGAAGKLRLVSGGLYESVNTSSGFGFRAFNGTPGVFVEAGGVFRHNASNGAAFHVGPDVPFDVNSGTLQVTGANGSALNLNGIGTLANATLVPAINTTINFSGNNNTVIGTLNGSGAGVVNLASGQLHATVAGATLNFPAGLFNLGGTGSLSGPGVFTNAGTIQITGGEPDLATELLNLGTIQHGNAYLDLDGAAAKLRLVSGGLYESINTSSGFGFRAFNGTPGVFVEAGGVFRHNASNGAAFHVGPDVPFDVNSGTLQVTGANGSGLNLNGIGTLANATLVPAINTTINFSGNNNTVVGTLSGSGAGVVNLASGQLHATVAGATLNLPAGLFNLSGTGSLSGPGVFTNAGTIQITGGEPDLATELLNLGTIQHGNAYLDLNGTAAKLRLVSGGLYESINTSSGFGFRAFAGAQGVFVESGGVFRHNASNGAAFHIGPDVPFDVNSGTLQVTGANGSALNLNGIGTLANATLVPAINTTINFSGNNNTVVGTLSGSGAGVVNFASGQLHATASGATLNFPAGLFNLSGTGSLSGPGVFTNAGTIQITGGEPDLATELVNVGKITHGNAYFDLNGAAGKLRVIAGGLYESVNTSSGFGFRAFAGTLGVAIEAGAVFRHAPSNGAAFNVGQDVPFNASGGTLETAGGNAAALNLNGIGKFTNATLVPAINTTINFSGNNNTVVGTLSGSGAGVVNFASGQLHATAAGATLNFPAALFNLGGTGSLSGPGVFTNTGTIQITGGEPDLATELVNAGKIAHGNAYFDLDGAAAKLRVIAGGLYESVNTSSGFGFRATNGTPGVFVEAGATFRHNTSNGAQFNVGAGTPFSNLGTVSATNGALVFATAPAQISGATATATLNGGAWEVANGATLNLGITGLRANAASISVGGTGAFSGLGALATNSGSLALLAGADLTTTQPFTNTGALTLSAGTLLAAPSYSQFATGSVAFEIGGASTNQIGRIVTTGAATLSGTASISVASSYSPAAGQSFPLMSFGSRNGVFASVAGLNVGHAPLFEAVTGAATFTLNSLVNASNLTVQSVVTPAAVAAGNDVFISYTVRNDGAFETPASSWSDTVYLSRDGVVDSSDIVLTRVAHTGALPAGQTYSVFTSVPLVGALPGDYQIIVVADALGRVADTDRANNTLASSGAFALSVPTLTPGVAFSGTIASGRDQYFQITLPAGQTPTFTFTGSVAGEAEIYASLGDVPTRASFLEKAFNSGSTVQQIVSDVSAAGTYYVLVHGRESAGAGQSFSLVGNGAGFDLTSSSLTTGANIGKVTATLTGSQFSPATAFTLVPTSGAPRAASAVYFVNARTVHATFDLTGLAAGAYDIVATKGAASDSLDDAFTVTSGGTPGTLKYSVSSPSFVRPQGGTVTVTFENTGSTDIDAPLFNLLAQNARLRLADETTFLGSTFTLPNGQPLTVVELLGVSGGLAGILSPGERGSIELAFQGINVATGAVAKFEVQPVGATNDPVNFSGLKDDLRPDGVRTDAWDAVFANFQTGIGGTTASYRKMLVENANYLGQFGPVAADATRLVEFELEQAGDFGAVFSRYALGDFGRGSAGPFSLQAATEADGDVVLSDGLTTRTFTALGGGVFAGTNIDAGKLTRGSTGAFTLTEPTGEKVVFRASDGRIDFVEDTNGNRVTAARNASGQLLTLTESATGDVTTFTHNAQGRIGTVTDAVGRVTTYGYDASGEHLTSVTTPRGTTGYTYTATGHNIDTITDVNGVGTDFDYDSFGRRTKQTIGTGANAVVTNYAYDNAGLLTVTDSAGHASQVFRTFGGVAARLIDAEGDVISSKFDSAGRLLSVTDSAGVSTKTVLGADGLLDQIVAPGRGQISVDLSGTIRRMQSVTDAGGDKTQFQYDSKGNLISTLLPDGFGETVEHDAKGRVSAATNANGERIVFTYNAASLIETRTLADGSLTTFTYDTHRNLKTATDADGVTTYGYDAADRITSVAYPNGKSVAITYDALGRRETISDQGGYTVRYTYDALGRLDVMRDTAGTLLVDYDYNSLGQLTLETRGNGSKTGYTYTDAGQVASITHRDAADAITGFFNYSYDSQDRVVKVVTEDGTTTYGYDLDGQLVRTVLPGGRTLAFTYDAEGNRTTVADTAGGAENYSTNNGDQYTSAGAETLGYDNAGRLILRTEGGISTSYTYDAQSHLTGIIKPGLIIAYDYDAMGNRIGKIENGVRTDFAIDPAGLTTVFGEYSGASTVNYASGLGVAARASGGNTSFYHFDSNGNTSLVSGAAGAAVATYEYLPFGQIASQTGSLAQPFTFGGRIGVQDDAGDLFQMRARTYDADLGRFTTRDPIGFSGGDANTYRYVNNSPVNFHDPSGLLLGGDPLSVSVGQAYLEGLYIEASNAAGAVYAEAVAAGPGVANTGRFLLGTGEAIGSELVIPAAGTGAAAVGTDVTLGYSGSALAARTGLGTLASVTGAGLLTATASIGSGLVLAKVAAPKLIAGAEGIDNYFRNNRDAHAKALGYPDGSEPHFSPDFVREKGKNPYFNDIVRKGIEDGLTQDEAILDAIRILKKLGLENETGPGTPNTTESRIVRPSDPNNIIGPAGAGADVVPDVIEPGQFRFDGFVSGKADFSYKIEFENKPSATAPAQVVYVTQTLDADLDLSTFQFKSFAFGAFTVPVPAGANGTSFHTVFDATATLGVLVQIDAELNTITRALNVTYTSLDPATNDVPLDPFAGFLPPDDGSGKGDGFLTYTVAPKAALANATEFTGIASIVFDTEDAIATPTVTNTLDSIAPTSSISAFASATTSRLSFPVRWTGADNVGGSGLAGITLSFTDNDGPLQTATVANAAGGFRFTGELGHTYKFFSQAVDNVGNVSTIPGAPERTITVVAPTLISNKDGAKLRTFTDEDGDTYTIALAGPGTLNVVLLDPDGNGKGSIDQIFLSGSTAKSKVTVAVKRAKDGPDADKLPDGDGIVSIGDINITGDLAAFSAKASDLTVDGIVATGAVGKVVVRDMIAVDPFAGTPGIKSVGTVATKTKLALTARNISDGAFSIGNAITAIKAASIGNADIVAPSLGTLSTRVGALNASLTIAGTVGAITAKLGANSGQWSAAAFGAITLGGKLEADITSSGIIGAVAAGTGIDGDIDATGAIKSVTVKNGALNGQVTGATIGAVSVTGGDFAGFIGADAAPGKTKGLMSLTVNGGNLNGDILVAGDVGTITAKASKTGTGGGISGDLTANSFGVISATGGGLTGNVTAAGTAASLGKAAAIAGISITGGDLASDISTLGVLGAITVKASKTAVGGSVLGSSILATKIAAITVAKNITDSILLAGASFGADGALGGTDDTFAAGKIGAVNVGGDVAASTIGAGLFTTNAILKDSDDSILGGVASSIAKLIIKGTADPASYFAAGKFAAAPRIGATTVDPETDVRFLVA